MPNYFTGAQEFLNLGLPRETAREDQRRWDLQWEDYLRQKQEQQTAAQQIGGGLTGLVNQYNQAYTGAKAANEQRYQQMLGIADQTTGQRAADIRSDYGQQGSKVMQNLARLGMANTTVAPTMQMGVNREMQSSLNRAADELQGTKLGIMERRTDKYPDIGLLTQLISGAGQLGGGTGLASIISALGALKQ